MLPRALYQSALLWGGVTDTTTGGFFAIGPREDYLGNLSFPAASAGSWGLTQPTADRGINAIATYKQKTYVGGKLSRFGDVLVFGIAVYDGVIVQPLGSGVDGTVYAMKPYGEVLVVGGGFTKVFQPLASELGAAADGGIVSTGGLASWDGSKWDLVGNSPVLGVVTTMLVNSSLLYIGGRFNDEGVSVSSSLPVLLTHVYKPSHFNLLADHRNNLAVYDGTEWHSVCGGGGECGVTGGNVNAISYWNQNLYVGGSFISAGGVSASRLAHWNGYQWSAMGTLDGDVLAIASLDDQLFVGGEFQSINSMSMPNIARFRNGMWESVGGGLGGPVYTIVALDSCVYVGGSFTSAGGLSKIGEVPIRHAVRRCARGSVGGKWEPIDWGDLDPGITLAIAAT